MKMNNNNAYQYNSTIVLLKITQIVHSTLNNKSSIVQTNFVQEKNIFVFLIFIRTYNYYFSIININDYFSLIEE